MAPLALGAFLLAATPAEAEQFGPLAPEDLAGAWALTLEPKPGVSIKVTDASGRPLDLSMDLWVDVRFGRVHRCRAKISGVEAQVQPVRCGLRKGVFTVTADAGQGAGSGRLVVRLTRQATGGISGDAFARAGMVPLGFNIGRAFLTRAAS